MSNVGVRIGGEQNSGPKGSEVSEAESNAFKGFDMGSVYWIKP